MFDTRGMHRQVGASQTGPGYAPTMLRPDRPPPQPGWSASFGGWIWSWSFALMFRGFSTARIYVYPGKLVFRSTRLEYLFHGWDTISYEWPTVVMQRLRPSGGWLILFAWDGVLASCATPFWSGKCRRAIRDAGFNIVEHRTWGWEAPRRVPRSALGPHADEVPPCVIAGGG